MINTIAEVASSHVSPLQNHDQSLVSRLVTNRVENAPQSGLSTEVSGNTNTYLSSLAGGAIKLSANDEQQQYSNVYVFGDSLSDIGNLNSVRPDMPERFSNGPVVAELVADQLGFELTASLHLLPPGSVENGNNFAVGGAVAIDNDGDLTTPDINLPTQINAYLQLNGGKSDPNALHMVMIGGNDLFAAQDIMLEGDWGSYFDAIDRISQAAASVEQELRTLVASGAENIVVANAPDIGATPNTDLKADKTLEEADSIRDYLTGGFLEGISRHLSQVYNDKLAEAVRNVEQDTGVDIQEFDLFSELDYILDNHSALGFENSTEFCGQNGEVDPDCDINDHVFYDAVHPSAATHMKTAENFLDRLV